MMPPDRSTQAATVWLTGLSGSGKTTIGRLLVETLHEQGRSAVLLDGDEIRMHVTRDLGFSRADRDQQVERVGWLCELLNRHGVIAVAAIVSPYRDARALVRSRIQSFIEVHVDAPLDVLRRRDPKGLYRDSTQGQLRGLTGVDAPYEAPGTPELVCRSDGIEGASACVARIIAILGPATSA